MTHRLPIFFLSCAAALALSPQRAQAGRRAPLVTVSLHGRVPPPALRGGWHPSPAATRLRCPGPDQAWVEGHKGRGGKWVSGHCSQVGAPPKSGWVYVPGHHDGKAWVRGFWRPPSRTGYHWVEARVDERKGYRAGYWEPDGPAPIGKIWRPGHWDGRSWHQGQWVELESYTMYDEQGEVAFFAVGDGQVQDVQMGEESAPLAAEEQALALPVDEEPWAIPAEQVREVPLGEQGGTEVRETEAWEMEYSEVEGTRVRHHGVPE